jgi:hypothetical protein
LVKVHINGCLLRSQKAFSVHRSHKQINHRELGRTKSDYTTRIIGTTTSGTPGNNASVEQDTMPEAATTAKRGPLIENGNGVQYDAGYNRPNGHSASGRAQINTEGQGSADIDLVPDSNSILNAPIHHDHTSQQHHHQATPLFERLVTEEVQELKAYVRIVESQNRRLVELERVHGDLEVRLEQETNTRQQLEATLELREREWVERLEHIERDRDVWKTLVEAEKIKNSKLLDQVHRKDQDIHRMLQRKVHNISYSCFHRFMLMKHSGF